MSGPAHSPAPFQRIAAGEDHGHIILDALGDSIGALAKSTGDHPAEEQLANALLFTASPDLLIAVKQLIAQWKTPTRYASPKIKAMNELVASAEVVVANAEGRA